MNKYIDFSDEVRRALEMGSDSMEAQKHMIIQNAVLAAEVAGKICC